MNSIRRRNSRTNARRRTPLSNSPRTDHNRSTTELYSPETHPRPTLRATTPPPPPRARTTRSNTFPPCPEILRTMRPLQRSSLSAQLTRISAPEFQPPDRPHDHGFDRAHDRALRAHTRTRRPRAHTRDTPRTRWLHALMRCRTQHTHTPSCAHTRWVYS